MASQYLYSFSRIFCKVQGVDPEAVPEAMISSKLLYMVFLDSKMQRSSQVVGLMVCSRSESFSHSPNYICPEVYCLIFKTAAFTFLSHMKHLNPSGVWETKLCKLYVFPSTHIFCVLQAASLFASTQMAKAAQLITSVHITCIFRPFFQAPSFSLSYPSTISITILEACTELMHESN